MGNDGNGNEKQDKIKELWMKTNDLISQRNIPEALSLLDEILILVPNNVDALYQSALLRYNIYMETIQKYQGSTGKAEKKDSISLDEEKELKQALEHKNMAYYQLSHAISIEPKHIGLYLSLSEMYLRDNQPDKAAKLLETAASLTPDNKNVLTSLGAVYLDLQKYEESVFCLEKAYSIDKEDVEVKQGLAIAANFLGERLLKEKDFEAAKSLFHKSIQLEENYVRPYYNLGIIAETQGNLKEAYQFYHKSYERNPESPDGLFSMGRILFNIGDNENALIAFKEVKQLDLNYPNIEAYIDKCQEE